MKNYLLRVDDELWEKILETKARIENEKNIALSINKFLCLLIEIGVKKVSEVK